MRRFSLSLLYFEAGLVEFVDFVSFAVHFCNIFLLIAGGQFGVYCEGYSCRPSGSYHIAMYSLVTAKAATSVPSRVVVIGVGHREAIIVQLPQFCLNVLCIQATMAAGLCLVGSFCSCILTMLAVYGMTDASAGRQDANLRSLSAL